MKKLISFNDFKFDLKSDILKEDLEDGVEEIIPEGLPESDHDPRMSPKHGMNDTEKRESINDFLDDDVNDDVIEAIVNQLRDVLLEMEQQGFVDEETTDQLDEEFDGDWIAWIKAVIDLPDFPEEGLNNIMYIISTEEEWGEDDEDDVECPDCEGTGEGEDGEDCERCEGTGRVYRPDDIPPDE